MTKDASGPVVLGMEWHDVLFAHWPLPVDAVRPHVPAGLEIDAFDGSAWLGIVPFVMKRVRPLALPFPLGRFTMAEVNVRTYVIGQGRPGIWLFSLDVSDRLNAIAGRVGYHLPYIHSRVRATADGDGVAFESRRRSGPPAEFRARYRPTGPAFTAVPGSLDAFLTNRLSLFAADRSGRLRRGDVDHGPWSLQPADAEIERNTLAAGHGLQLPDLPPRLLFARRIEVLARAPSQPFS